ncbi:hypothetical protein ANANG_G00305570 [Anguilla anguilla]|uniref:Uncharacterized protein n=1 Tax=Anguilla anguilla TaxID=7936 RepID=A0A9D3RIJ8_ANGAN|nr:hypothetical protein ANANG_G00305570 [Anguilla anguilla]
MPPQGEVFYEDKDQYEDSRGMRTTEEPDDFLLPHERAFQDGGGFSRIVGMKHGLQAEAEDGWREGDVEDEERFLYGERADEGERGRAAAAEADRAPGAPPGRDRAETEGRGQAAALRQDPEPAPDHRPRPGPRGGQQADGQDPGAALREEAEERAARAHRLRVGAGGPQGALEHSSARDQERFATDARTVRSSRKSRSPARSTPSSSSSSKYSRAPQEPYSQYQSAPEHELAYVSPFLPPHSLPHVTLASPVGLPAGLSSPFAGPPAVSLPSFLQQPSATFSGATSYYSLHPLTGVPILAPVGGAAFPVSQPVPAGGGEVETHARELATTKSRCLRVIKTVKLHSHSPAQSSNLKEVTTTGGEQSSDSALAPCPAPRGPAEKKQVTTISEDDIKAKQKKRLEQFNERMRQKKEQQKEAMRSRVKCQKIPPGKTCTEVKNVWVCGHSLVFWAEKRAKSPEYGMQLGMDPGRVRVWWKGMQGMTWDQLLPLLLQLKGSWPNPDVIILHLGGNDLGRRRAMEGHRALVNRRVRGDLAELGGAAVTHDSIRPGSDAGLYRPDGVHLSGKGIDMFNIDLQDFLEKWDGEEAESSEPV